MRKLGRALEFKPMGNPTERRTCKKCGRPREEVGQMSWTGQCFDCAEAAVKENIAGLATMSGEPLRRWRRGMVASVGGVLLDEVHPGG